MTPTNLEKTLEYFRSNKAYGLKVSQSMIYVKEYSYMFFSTLKDII